MLPPALPAHPRVGGENVWWQWSTRRAVGSSPRGRGKPRRGSGAESFSRLIPAWAGKTLIILRELQANSGHPRVGGENGNRLRGL